MEIKFTGIGLNAEKDFLSYQITNDENEDIGTIEGAGNMGCLFSPQFHFL